MRPFWQRKSEHVFSASSQTLTIEGSTNICSKSVKWKCPKLMDNGFVRIADLPPKEYREQPRSSRFTLNYTTSGSGSYDWWVLFGDTIITKLRFFFGASGVNRVGWWRHFSRKWPLEVGSAWVTIHIERLLGLFKFCQFYLVEINLSETNGFQNSRNLIMWPSELGLWDKMQQQQQQRTWKGLQICIYRI